MKKKKREKNQGKLTKKKIRQDNRKKEHKGSSMCVSK
jgi:hypothetical protein